MNIKNLILVIIGLLVTTSLHAGTLYKNVHIGLSSVKVLDKSSVGYTVGFGYSKTYDKVYLGAAFDFDISRVANKDTYAYGANIKIGYTLLQGLSMYGIGSVMHHSLSNVSGGGFGYGGGIEYIFSDSFAIGSEYITHKMTLDGSLKYDYRKSTTFLKYLF